MANLRWFLKNGGDYRDHSVVAVVMLQDPRPSRRPSRAPFELVALPMHMPAPPPRLQLAGSAPQSPQLQLAGATPQGTQQIMVSFQTADENPADGGQNGAWLTDAGLDGAFRLLRAP
jgi:hypothetical protein